jgi:hypothetical protein
MISLYPVIANKMVIDIFNYRWDVYYWDIINQVKLLLDIIKMLLCFYTIGSLIIDIIKTYMLYGCNVNETYISGCTQY